MQHTELLQVFFSNFRKNSFSKKSIYFGIFTKISMKPRKISLHVIQYYMQVEIIALQGTLKS